MSVIRFPKQPLRFICVRGRGEEWYCTYDGDPWQKLWRSEFGTHYQVMDLIASLNCGLPVITITDDGARGAA